jgi:Flp pilus assembly protein TadD
LIKAGDWESQASLMAEAIAAFPKEPEFWLRHALAVFDDPHAAVESAGKAAELGAGDPGLLTRCASLLFDLERDEDARSLVRQVSVLAPDGFALTSNVLHLAGKLATRKGNNEVAERYLSKAFEVDPLSNGHAIVFAEFLTSVGRTPEALGVIARGLRRGSPDREGLLDLRRRINA